MAISPDHLLNLDSNTRDDAKTNPMEGFGNDC